MQIETWALFLNTCPKTWNINLLYNQYKRFHEIFGPVVGYVIGQNAGTFRIGYWSAEDMAASPGEAIDA